MSTGGKRALTMVAGIVGFAIPMLLFFPTGCWVAECPQGAVDCQSSGCDSLSFGMSEAGPLFGLAIFGGIAVAWLFAAIARRLMRER
jgi:hypothetical protein